MIGLNIRVVGADKVVNHFVARSKAVHSELRTATRDGVGLVKASALDRVVPARSINIQDGRQYRRLSGRKPVRTLFEADGLAGFVRVGQHQTVVRSKALQNVYARIGRSSDLYRTRGLFINPASWIKGPGGRFQGRKKQRYNAGTDTNLVLFRFKYHPALEDWANRRDRGYQIMRHSIRLRREAITLLTTAPALRVNRQTIQSLYRAATIAGLA